MTTPTDLHRALAEVAQNAADEYEHWTNPWTETGEREAIAQALAEKMPGWRPISSEPADGSPIWISDGKNVWLGVAHTDGSLKLPDRYLCKFWMPALIPPPPESP